MKNILALFVVMIILAKTYYNDPYGAYPVDQYSQQQVDPYGERYCKDATTGKLRQCYYSE